MNDTSAQKKPPEKPRPRGAEDTIHFRERLDVPRPHHEWHGSARQSSYRIQLYSKRTAQASLPAARRFVVRRDGLLRTPPDADPYDGNLTASRTRPSLGEVTFDS